MKKRKSLKKNDIKIIGTFVVIVMMFFIIICSLFTKDNGYDKYKSIKKENLVYTIYNEGNTYVPAINLNDPAIDMLNELIVGTANSFLSTHPKNVITYTYELNGKILSVAIQYLSRLDTYPKITYDVYNIRVSDYHILDNKEILEMYDINEEQVRGVVESKFKSFYVDLFDKKYFDEECNYDCFMYMRGLQGKDYLDEAYYYIKQGNLYVIRPFNIYSTFKEENYFSSKDFLIQITE